jgi:hypothetical protein
MIQTEWNQPTAAGNMLRQSLEVFQMETGFALNILEADYSLGSSPSLLMAGGNNCGVSAIDMMSSFSWAHVG